MSAVDTTTVLTIPNITPILPYTVYLYLYSILLTLAIPCYLFVFYHLLASSTNRSALKNHVIILMLMVFFAQAALSNTMHLDQFRRGYYWPPSLGYCYFLYMVDYVIYLNGALLMVWFSFERHLLIFNAAVFNSRTGRITLHYIPMAFCIVYPLVYYTYFILFYPCESYYDMSTLNCFAACFLWTSRVMVFYELFVNGFAPVCLVAFLSVWLLVRVIYSKRQRGQQMSWRKARKMTLQLLSITASFLLLNIGYFVLAIGQMAYDPSFGADYMVWFAFINICTQQLLIPFQCLSVVPNAAAKLRALFTCRRCITNQPLNRQRTQVYPTRNDTTRR